MSIEKIITNEKGIVADFQNAINTHIVSGGLSVEELCCDDTEVIEEQLARWQKNVDYHNTIVTCLEKYEKIEQIVNSKTTRVSYEDGFRQIRKVIEDGTD